MSLGSRIKELRKLKGWKLWELSKATGISVGSLGDLEHDRQKSSTKLHMLVAALGTTFDYLEHGKGPKMAATAVKRGYAVQESVAQWPATLTPEEAHVGKEWGKLDEPARTQLLVMIESLVARQIKSKRKAGKTQHEHTDDAH